MTPKEKAKEIFIGFYRELPPQSATPFDMNEIAKKCASICVDEIIEELKRYTDPDSLGVLYWNDVKKEIEKL